MKIKQGYSLLLINLLAIILVLIINIIPISPIRIILAFPFVLFFPGFVLTKALFPKNNSMDNVSSIALSFGLSIAIVVILGFVLNYTPLGLHLESLLYSTFITIVILSIIGWLRLNWLPKDERKDIELLLPRFGIRIRDKVLSIILIVTILGALGMMIFSIVAPKIGEQYTEFYILGTDGKADNYIQQLSIGQQGQVTLGIVNHEYNEITYRIEVKINGVSNNIIDNITLDNGQKWENEVSFIPKVEDSNSEVEFYIYMGADTQPLFKPLNLWINVSN